MELYISDHPLDCLTCSANGNCELQTVAGQVGLREVRYGYDGANHLARKGRFQPVFRLRPEQVHRLQPLRARLRGNPGHLRPDHYRARFRIAGGGGGDDFLTPNACPAAPACRPARPPP
jgi:formate dehydrogenase major subunit